MTYARSTSPNQMGSIVDETWTGIKWHRNSANLSIKFQHKSERTHEFGYNAGPAGKEINPD